MGRIPDLLPGNIALMASILNGHEIRKRDEYLVSKVNGISRLYSAVIEGKDKGKWIDSGHLPVLINSVV